MSGSREAVELSETPSSTETAVETRTRRRFRPQTFAAFGSSSFRLLWVSTFSFMLVQGMQRFAFAWLVLALSTGTGAAGAVVFAFGIPVFFVTLPAGVVSDRMDRRTLLAVSQLVGAVIMAAATALVWTDLMTTPLAFALAIVSGTTMAVGQPVLRAIVPSIVPRERIVNAIVLTSMAGNVSRILGTAVGGLAIALWGLGGAFALQAVLFAVSGLVILPLKLQRPSESAGRGQLVADLLDGVRFVRERRDILSLMLLMSVSGLLMIGPTLVLLPEISRERLGQDAFATSMLSGVFSAGTLVSSLVLASLGDMKNKGGVFLASVVMRGAAAAAIGVSPWFALTLSVMFPYGMIAGVFMNLNQTLVQSRTPLEVMGRVTALHTLALAGATPLGTLFAGFGGDVVGVTGWMVACGTALGVIGLTTLLAQPSLRRMA